MSILSANTLFHFTKKEALLGILDSGFRASFCLEFNEQRGYPFPPVYIAMICFCDIPISMLDKHLNGHSWDYEGKNREFKGYGRFGLGMSKEWGINNGLNPVVYVNVDSKYSLSSVRTNNILGYEMAELRDLIFRLKNERSKDRSLVDKLDEIFFKLKQALSYSDISMCFSKPYQSTHDGRRYYDEREWRFIPWIPGVDKWEKMHSIEPVVVPLNKDYTDAMLSGYRKQFVENTLKFKAEDVKYIIVESDRDIDNVIETLENIATKEPVRYSGEAIYRLTTRIITYEQINEDF